MSYSVITLLTHIVVIFTIMVGTMIPSSYYRLSHTKIAIILIMGHFLLFLKFFELWKFLDYREGFSIWSSIWDVRESGRALPSFSNLRPSIFSISGRYIWTVRTFNTQFEIHQIIEKLKNMRIPINLHITTTHNTRIENTVNIAIGAFKWLAIKWFF